MKPGYITGIHSKNGIPTCLGTINYGAASGTPIVWTFTPQEGSPFFKPNVGTVSPTSGFGLTFHFRRKPRYLLRIRKG